ncbi:MAG TPA: type III-A CRISPR-associated RAMP protein Csm3 [Spirochaetales bacterium]|nr:type III-A CRISPR-associated RAMP protein Csm3 [Spirochaetales bacterium]
MNKFQLIKIKEIKGKIKIMTGLHIGTGSDKIEIGGMDNPIIKDPLTGAPYIPGSSLKGKMRSLMEWKLNKVLDYKGNPCKCGECEICTVFGTAAAEKKEEVRERAFKRGPTRIIVRDACLTEEFQKKFRNGEQLIEEKYENSLNRITAEANPRPIERVIPGVEFDFSLVYKVLNRDDEGMKDENLFNEIVLYALAALQEDYLGGGGSRGNGKIQFVDLIDESGNVVNLPKV